MADAPALGAGEATRGGSTPPTRTQKKLRSLRSFFIETYRIIILTQHQVFLLWLF